MYGATHSWSSPFPLDPQSQNINHDYPYPSQTQPQEPMFTQDSYQDQFSPFLPPSNNNSGFISGQSQPQTVPHQNQFFTDTSPSAGIPIATSVNQQIDPSYNLATLSQPQQPHTSFSPHASYLNPSFDSGNANIPAPYMSASPQSSPSILSGALGGGGGDIMGQNITPSPQFPSFDPSGPSTHYHPQSQSPNSKQKRHRGVDSGDDYSAHGSEAPPETVKSKPSVQSPFIAFIHLFLVGLFLIMITQSRLCPL